jgi:hypothetical protein
VRHYSASGLEPWRRFQFCEPRLHVIERTAKAAAVLRVQEGGW